MAKGMSSLSSFSGDMIDPHKLVWSGSLARLPSTVMMTGMRRVARTAWLMSKYSALIRISNSAKGVQSHHTVQDTNNLAITIQDRDETHVEVRLNLWIDDAGNVWICDFLGRVVQKQKHVWNLHRLACTVSKTRTASSAWPLVAWSSACIVDRFA